MEDLTQAFAPELLAIQQERWSSADDLCDGGDLSKDVTSSGRSFGEDTSLSLPDELLEKIFAMLPISYVFRARAVCRRWNTITTSRRFLKLSEDKAVSPWYFMCKESQSTEGVAYDPESKKWHSFSLPFLRDPSYFVASSNGLVCFADNSDRCVLYICNPLKQTWEKLPEPSERWFSDYYAVSLTIDQTTNVQAAVVARSSQVSDNYSCWMLSIEVCDSYSQRWRTACSATLNGWRGGDNSVICNGVFYSVIHSTAMVGSHVENCRHSLLSYDLSTSSLRVAFISMPCALTCAKLINCNGKLILVGGIGKSDIVKGIGVWQLGTEWTEISRMPNKFFRGFGEFDDVFSSSGTGELIYIHAFGSPQLLLFSLRNHSWRWSQKCPMVKKHPLHLFMGFSFEPRLGVCPWSSTR